MCLLGWDSDGNAVFARHEIKSNSGYKIIAHPDGDIKTAYRYRFNGEKVPYGEHWDLISIEDVCRQRGWSLNKNGGGSGGSGSEVEGGGSQSQLNDCKDKYKKLLEEFQDLRIQLGQVYDITNVTRGNKDELIKKLKKAFP